METSDTKKEATPSRNNSKNKNYPSNNIEGIKNTTDLEDSAELSVDEIFIGFSGNINVNAVFNNIPIFNQKKEPTKWIIDSGTSLNLTKKEKDPDDTKIVNNKFITYPEGKSDKIVKVRTYNGAIKNFDFTLSKVHYAPNIKNNLILTHYLVRNNFTIIIDFEEYLNNDRLQLFKNNKPVAKIYADKENLFSLYTTPFKIYKSLNIDISNFDYDLWHERLGHFNINKDIVRVFICILHFLIIRRVFIFGIFIFINFNHGRFGFINFYANIFIIGRVIFIYIWI